MSPGERRELMADITHSQFGSQPRLREDNAPELSPAERCLLNWLHILAENNRINARLADQEPRLIIKQKPVRSTLTWRYNGFAALLLDHGRLFDPGDLPADLDRGEPGTCFASAQANADAHGVVYVEGMATSGARSWIDTEHGWCARVGESTALDPTWHPPGAAYLGVPLHDEFRRDVRALTGAQHVLTFEHPAGWEFVQDGFRDGAVRDDVGRPLPDIARLGPNQ
jgi:hypothetical protein